MDQSWYGGDLNDDGLSFHMWTWWHGAPNVKLKLKNKLTPYNSHILGEKHNNINDLRWMNASITFGSPNVIRVILGNKFYFFAILAYSNLALLHQRGFLIKIHNTKYVDILIHFFTWGYCANIAL